MSNKRLYRYQTRYLKPNYNFKNKNGFLMYRLKGDKYDVGIILCDEVDPKLDIQQKYDKVEQLIHDDEYDVTIIQYYQIDDENGVQIESIFDITKMQMEHYRDGKIKKITQENFKYCQENI